MAQGQSHGKRVAIWIVGILIGLLALFVIGIGLYVRIAFGSFYAQAKDEFSIPGISEGFICQDLDYYDEAHAWLFSGHMTDEGPSPIYRVDSNGKTVKFYVKTSDDMTYKGHGAGITTSEDFAFLTCENGLLVFNAGDFAAVKDGGYVTAIDKIDLELTPAFANIENGTLYVGTFHRVPEYPAPPSHHRLTPDGSENAGIMLAYPGDEKGKYGFASHAVCAYSIPDLAQGVCVLPSGDIVLSRSWGIGASHISTFSTREGCIIEEFAVDGNTVPLFILSKASMIADVVAPPMSEGIEYHEGRIYIAEESASNKYIFGKLYGAGEVYSIPM